MDSRQRFNEPSIPYPKSAEALFAKDQGFFQLLLVLINKSCPIKSVDLVWRSSEPSGSELIQITGTAEALRGASSRYVSSDGKALNPRFCELVNAGCSASDKAAEARVSINGEPDIYRCHAGLIDIAVPVMANGRHIATLFTGQVLRSTPTPEGFREVLHDIRNLGAIDHAQLREAYQKVPVVTDDDIQHTVSILKVFAEHLATTWKRLLDASEAQELRLRESQLLRKEMAQILLGGQVREGARLREIARVLGFTSYPNRVLIVQPQGEIEPGTTSSSPDLELTRTLYAVEDLAANLKNVMAVHLHRRGICIFVADKGARTGTLSELKPYGLAQKMMNFIQQQHSLRIRIGVGRAKEEWHRIAESYQEAWAALAESDVSVAFYKDPPEALNALSSQMALACQALSRLDLHHARSALHSILVSANCQLGNHHESFHALRQWLISALDALVLSAQSLACDAKHLEGWRRESCESLERSTTSFELHESWTNCIEQLLLETKRLYSGKHEKIIEHARILIRKNIDRPEGSLPVMIEEIADVLGVSVGHLSRTFKKIAGMTFERYVLEKRVERARKLLLDPNSRVSEVAEKCDFCNPAYFARAFRKVIGCSPTDFCKDPNRYALAIGMAGVRKKMGDDLTRKIDDSGCQTHELASIAHGAPLRGVDPVRRRELL